MKSLFEIVTNHVGESYVRSYCWAHCEEDARELFKLVAERDRVSTYEIQSVRRLFTAESCEFITKPSDSGFQTEGMVEIADFRHYSVKLRANEMN